MTPTIDPRIADRRRRVHDQRARVGIRRTIWFLAVVATAGILLWIGQSPWLAVKTITIDGVVHSAAAEILIAEEISIGRPLLIVRASRAEEALRLDPWVIDAAVTKVLPGTVEVVVVERIAGAFLETMDGTNLLAGDGTVLPLVETSALGRIRLSAIVPPVGETVDDLSVVGALEFLGGLPGDLAAGVVVFETNDELWAEVGTHDVRLGRPIDMPQKAAALVAVLSLGQPEGSLINVIAPTRPTVVPGG
ncbi:MAG: FtsQ-type POTRA domain-containing protein [Acidimicrobiia bacterium]|nr:FtsQ-type POTRA domain-containing protein [Acidimicrobiia bacterium]